MTGFLLASENLPFLAAAAFVLLMAAAEGVLLALGLSSDALLGDKAVEAPEDGGADGAPGFLAWLGFGRVPLAVLLIALGAAFAIAGFAIQAIAGAALGWLLPWPLAAPLALVPALPLTRAAATAIGRLVPREETYVATRASLVGRVGVVVQGEATAALAAEARVPDGHGGSIYVRVFPAEPGQRIPQGTRIALVARSGQDAFVAMPLPADEGGAAGPS